jgi:hypothetical protein
MSTPTPTPTAYLTEEQLREEVVQRAWDALQRLVCLIRNGDLTEPDVFILRGYYWELFRSMRDYLNGGFTLEPLLPRLSTTIDPVDYRIPPRLRPRRPEMVVTREVATGRVTHVDWIRDKDRMPGYG